ncbi:ABC transporter permease [Ilumatobacter sp.]|uniref:ABC transporter permease n=1 Tax=Ilumatobacter sp. TaxID=1967498 RepID=UPI003B51B15F
MLKLIGRRILALIPLLFMVSLIVFLLVSIIPGDPAVTLAGENASESRIATIRETLGLNDSLISQYWAFISRVVTLDLGTSLFSSSEVFELIRQRAPATISLTLGALVFAIVVGIPAGLIAGARQGKPADRIVMLGATSGVALPSYFLAILFILFFAVRNSWFPATGYVPPERGYVEWLKSIALPAVALGTNGAALIARQLRSSLVDVLQQDYIRTARAKGLRGRSVVLKHAFKNSAAPMVTVLGIQVAYLLGGTVVIEYIFGIAGLGQLAYSAVIQKDVPLIQGIVMVMALAVVAVNLLIDVTYAYLDPKVRSR